MCMCVFFVVCILFSFQYHVCSYSRLTPNLYTHLRFLTTLTMVLHSWWNTFTLGGYCKWDLGLLGVLLYVCVCVFVCSSVTYTYIVVYWLCVFMRILCYGLLWLSTKDKCFCGLLNIYLCIGSRGRVGGWWVMWWWAVGRGYFFSYTIYL